MNTQVFVTIGIPLYNAEKFLKTAINSVLNQTHANFELIITDDGSTDQSVKIVKSFNDPRIVLLTDDTNKGISYRLNQQIELAKGKYFFRMDGDDIMFPERLESQIGFMEQNPNVDVVGSSAVIIDDENNIIGIRKGLIPSSTEEAVKSSLFIHPTVCGKSSWFKQYKYNAAVDGVEDFDLWLRAWEKSNFEILSKPLLFYRDPLEFKINIYLDRMKKQRRMFLQNDIFKGNKNKVIKLILISHFKGLAARILNLAGRDHFLISRRNKEITVDIDKYSDLLRNI